MGDDASKYVKVLRQDGGAEGMQRALAYHLNGRLDQAEAAYKAILKIEPEHADALQLLGALFYQKKNFPEAIAYLQKALTHKPGNADVYSNLGNAFLAEGRIDEAIQCFREIIVRKGDDAGTFYNLGNAFKEKKMFKEALAHYEKAIAINPYLAEAHYNYGNALQDACRADAPAVPHYRHAIGLKADFAEAHWNLSLALLLTGSFAEGWKEYEWRREMREIFAKRDLGGQDWGGEDLAGKRILVYAEQGFGDTIQFIRYARQLAGRGAEVLVECQGELVRLLSGVAGVNKVYGRGEVLPSYDYRCPILSLPGLFGTELGTIPCKVPYIGGLEESLSYWRERLSGDGPGLKVGLSWAGRPTHKKDRYRTLKLLQYGPLGGMAGVTFYSLQKGESSGESQHPPEGMRLLDYTGELSDFSDTAGLIGNLDLVISVDTAVVHLAGALGKAVWTLLPYAPDWRWMLDREDSPWYPTMRLYRQETPGDWERVIGRVAAELAAYPC